MLEAKLQWQWLALELLVRLYLQHGSGASPAPYAAGILGLAGAGLGYKYHLKIGQMTKAIK